MNKMNCKIVSTEKSSVYAGLKSITLPGLIGEAEILPGHAELFMELGKGNVILLNDNKISVPVSGGVCHIGGDEVVIVL